MSYRDLEALVDIGRELLRTARSVDCPTYDRAGVPATLTIAIVNPVTIAIVNPGAVARLQRQLVAMGAIDEPDPNVATT